MTEIDRTLIGTETDVFIVEVEKGAIRKFADAIGDPNPLFRDETYARRFGYAGVFAPPTFPVCFRPPMDLPWVQNLDRRRIVAGQTEFEYMKRVVAGMRLSCRVKLAAVEEKVGSKGKMELLQQELRGEDERGEVVFIARRTTVYRSGEQVAQRSLA